MKSHLTRDRKPETGFPSEPTVIISKCLTSLKPSDTKTQATRCIVLERTRERCQRADPSMQVGWNTRDLLLYAVGIGAKREDLSLAFGT